MGALGVCICLYLQDKELSQLFELSPHSHYLSMAKGVFSSTRDLATLNHICGLWNMWWVTPTMMQYHVLCHSISWHICSILVACIISIIMIENLCCLNSFIISLDILPYDTVDGRTPAPPGTNTRSCIFNGIFFSHLSRLAGFLPSTPCHSKAIIPLAPLGSPETPPQQRRLRGGDPLLEISWRPLDPDFCWVFFSAVYFFHHF